jgi:hypothetical protein
MITRTETLTWQFGGWLGGLSPAVAWTVLGVGAALGAGAVWWSYRTALVELTPMRRSLLCMLRLTMWWSLLVILAAPTRVERRYGQPGAKPLAVMVDRSASMTTAGNRKQRRLDDALRRWRLFAPAARANFGDPETFVFAETVKSVSAVDGMADVSPDQTHLFAALSHVLDEAPVGGWGGIAILTDGLDTSGEAIDAQLDQAARSALAAGTPLYFVPGRNRYVGEAYFTLRDFTAPGQVAPRTTFRVEATFDSYQTAPRNVSARLKVDGVDRPASTLRLAAGRRLEAWSAEVQTEGPGMIELELQAGGEIARATVRVESPPTNRILYYQGALDWNYRFLTDILKRDTTFTLSPVFSFPNPKAPLPVGALGRFPGTLAELAAFDLVILANVIAPQLTPAQQAALDQWVREGGVLLFLAPDDDSTQGLAGSELEKMLPVVFADPRALDAASAALSTTMRNLRGGGGTDPTTLTPFAWEETLQVKGIFEIEAKTGTQLPRPLFANYAHVVAAKPGARVLARHPTATMPGSEERAILLAVQRYGRGHSCVLTTDSLWRWKLSQPSTERGAELFWQNLFSWLMRDRHRGLAFERAPRQLALGREAVLRVSGGEAEPLTVEAVLGSQRIRLGEEPAEGAVRVFAWRPATEGFWRINATSAAGQQTSHWISVKPAGRTGERAGQPPDEALLRTLADRTGGAVLENTPPVAWQQVRPDSGELLAERHTPVWHHPWVLGLLCGLYGLELLLRRWWKLL